MVDDQHLAVRKAILDYILLDLQEQNRVGLSIPKKVFKQIEHFRNFLKDRTSTDSN